MPPNVSPPRAELAYPVLWLAFALFVWIMAFSEWQRTRKRDYYVIGLAFTILVIRLLFPYLFFAMGYLGPKQVSQSFAIIINSAWENLSFAILAGVVIIRMTRSHLRFEKLLIAYFGFVFLLVLEVILIDKLFPLRNIVVWTPFVFTMLNIMILSFAIASCYSLKSSVHHFFRKAFWLFYVHQIVVFYFYIGSPDSVFRYSSDVLPILGASFIVLAVYSSIRDEIQVKTMRLNQLDAMKSRFLAVVSHELRTPLSSMKMSYDLLLSKKLGDVSSRQEEALSIIKNNSERLIRMIEELLDVSRIERGAFTLNLKKRDLIQFLQELVDEAKKSLIRRSKMLETRLPAQPVEMWFDPDKLSQVIINLLHNADRFNRENGSVQLLVQDDTDFVVFDVVDQGLGIPARQTLRIFESFVRAAPASGGQGGLGLGLHIAKMIVEAHGGSIGVAETGQQGTRIRFSLDKHLGQPRRTSDSPGGEQEPEPKSAAEGEAK